MQVVSEKAKSGRIINIKNLKISDPIQKQPEQGVEGEGISAMDPPGAYAPPATVALKPEDAHPFLRQFFDDHAVFLTELNNFENAILEIQKDGFTKELDFKLKQFFHFYDVELMPHNQREERILFPILHQRLIEAGEFGKGKVPTTAIDLMEDEHVKAMQLSTVVLNFLGLAFRLPDERSRLIVLDSALEQGKSLVELLRLHLFREDNVVFPLAHRYITQAEFDAMQARSVSELAIGKLGPASAAMSKAPLSF